MPVSRDEEIVVYVSSGSRPFSLPSLIGRTEKAAVSYLEQAGLNPRLRYEANEKPAGTVIAQFPEPGSFVQPGQSVDLVISSGPGEGAAEESGGDGEGAGGGNE